MITKLSFNYVFRSYLIFIYTFTYLFISIKLFTYYIFLDYYLYHHVSKCLEMNIYLLKSKYFLIFKKKSLDDDQTYWSWQIRAWINLCSVLIHIRYPLSAWSKTYYFISINFSNFYCKILLFNFFQSWDGKSPWNVPLVIQLIWRS